MKHIMTTKFGVFSETGQAKTDPYIDTVKPDHRDHGLNFKVGCWGQLLAPQHRPAAAVPNTFPALPCCSPQHARLGSSTTPASTS